MTRKTSLPVTFGLFPVYFRSQHSTQGTYQVTSGQVPVHLNKPVIFAANSGLRVGMTSEVTEVLNGGP